MKSRIAVSAPCRVDAGGTWDIKALALPMAKKSPATVNMALELRTTVTLHPFKDGEIKISSRGFSHTETGVADGLPFDTPFGLFFAAVSHYGFHGLEIRIESQSPVKSALGGSSTALVALLGALNRLDGVSHNKTGPSRDRVLHLAYHLEDAVGGGNCGIQDQAAAVYGGVHLWEWHFGRPHEPFKRTSLLDEKGRQALSKHILVAYSGKSHVAASTNRKWVKDFLSGRTRAGWIKANDSVHAFAEAVRSKDWDRAAFFLREEMAVRREITPEALDPVTEKMVGAAEEAGCGGRFAGAGAGGSVWALGSRENIEALGGKWRRMLASIEDARMLDGAIDGAGMRLE